MKDQKIPYINLGGAAVFGILTLWRLLTMVTTFFDWVGYWGFFQTVFTLVIPAIPWIAFYGLMAYTFFVNWRNPIPIYGVCAIAVWSLLGSLFSMAKAVFAFDFWSWLSTLPGFLHGIGLCALALIGVVLRTKWLPQLRQYARQLWFVPSAILALYTLIYFITSREYITFGNVLMKLLVLAGLGLVNLWLVASARDLGSLMPLVNKGVSAVSSAASSGNAAAPQGGSQAPASGVSNAPAAGEGFVSMGLHVVLLLLSCGIWLYVWIYRTTRFTNNVPGKDTRNPAAQLLLCMFIPLYIIFWTYETAKRVDQMSAYRGISSDLATLCLILAIFVPIVPPIMLQSKINALAQTAAPVVRRPAALPEQPKAPEAPEAPKQPQPEAPKAQPAPEAPEAPAAPQQPAVPKLTPAGVQELRMYKDLLDNGIITQEDFIEHRRRILGK